MKKILTGASPSRTPHGFTLIEILVVITLIGVIMGVAAFSVGGLDHRRLHSDAHELAAVLNHLVDESLMTQQDLQWVYDRETKRCAVLILDHENEWQPAPAGRRPSCDFDAINDLLVTTLDTPASPQTETEAEAEEQNNSVLFLASGDYRPFSLTLNPENGESLVLSGDGFNSIRVDTTAP